MAEPIKHLNSLSAFYEVLAQSAPRLLVVDFHAEWCGPCKRIAPVFAELARKHQKVAQFAKADVDEAQDLAQSAGVRAMPTFHIYKAGERVFELTGGDMGKLEAQVLQWGADVAAKVEVAEKETAAERGSNNISTGTSAIARSAKAPTIRLGSAGIIP